MDLAIDPFIPTWNNDTFFIFLFLAAIGYSWSRSIIDNKVLFKNFILHTNGLSSYNVYLKKITKIYLIFPLIMSEILLGLIEFIPIKQKALLFIFLIIVLITALVTRFYCKDYLPCKLFAKCFYVIFFLVLFSSFLCVCGRSLLNDTVKTHFYDIQYSLVIIYAISTVITLFLISYNILEFLKENKQNILIRILQPAIIFFCMMNVLWIPGWIVKFMNLGNYQAEQIYIIPAACQRLKATQLFDLTPQGSLTNIKVLWTMGDHSIFEVVVNERKEILSLDSKEIVIILKAPPSSVTTPTAKDKTLLPSGDPPPRLT